jgi:hypothetical protein
MLQSCTSTANQPAHLLRRRRLNLSGAIVSCLCRACCQIDSMKAGCSTSQSNDDKTELSMAPFQWFRIQHFAAQQPTLSPFQHMKQLYTLHYVMYTALLAQNHMKKHATNMKSMERAAQSRTAHSARCNCSSYSPQARACYRNYRHSSCCFWLHTS